MSLKDSLRELMFRNCLRLGEDARRKIDIAEAKYVCLPSKELPAEFTHKATRNSITISRGSDPSRFKACILFLPIEDNTLLHVTCYLRSEDSLINQINYLALTSDQLPEVRTQHLFIISGVLPYQENGNPEVESEILFEFTCSDNHKIIECGVRIHENEYFFDTLAWLDDSEDDDVDGTFTPIPVDNFRCVEYEAEAINDDCNYEPEAVDNTSYQKDEAEAVDVDNKAVGNISYQNVKGSQVENVDSTKHTSCWSCFRKRAWSKKKKTKASF